MYDDKNKKFIIKTIIIILLTAVVALLVINYVSLTNERPKQKEDKINISVINEYCSSFVKIIIEDKLNETIALKEKQKEETKKV